MRVVLDTNIVVSALLKPHGNEGQVLLQDYELLISDAILTEYRQVLARPHLHFTPQHQQTVISELLRRAEFIYPPTRLHISLDEDDNRFLECAITGLADYLVTGNTKDYPSVIGSLSVVNAREFLELTKP